MHYVSCISAASISCTLLMWWRNWILLAGGRVLGLFLSMVFTLR